MRVMAGCSAQSPLPSTMQRGPEAAAVEVAVVQPLALVLVDEVHAAPAVRHRAERGAVVDALAEGLRAGPSCPAASASSRTRMRVG